MKAIKFNCIVIWCVMVGMSLTVNAAERPGEAGIATAHPLATEAGHEILAAGGNAFDAAVAISAALGVVEPFASGLGGGAFWLLHLADERTDVFVDARESAPGAATADMFLGDDGEPIKGASFDGPLSAGIPGQAAGLVHLAEKYGRLPLATSLAPAIRYAEEGFPVGVRIGSGLRFRRRVAERWPAFGDVFYPGGESLQEGDLLRQPDLARTLRRFADGGRDGFYKGETARLLVEGSRAAGGIWTLRDLADYQVVEREPIGFFYGRVRILSAPPPSSGGIAIANMLNILKGYDLTQLDGVTRKHLIIESMRRAYRDRTEFLGDTDFTKVPVRQLLDANYAAGQRGSIRADRATPSDSLAEAAPVEAKGTNTTHFSVLDKNGNRVAGSMSINSWYGSAFMAPGTGVILNNEMDDFAIKPGVANSFGLTGYAANAIQPKKRMLSSMSPTFLEGERGIAILGTPGGSRIISMVLLASMAWMDGASAQEMVDLKRFHHQYLPDEVAFEEGAFTEEERKALEALGHTLTTSRRGYGNMNVVTWDFETGKVEAASDSRGHGEGRVY
jgi:gamma-glutamyltranspeptidase/glutathione hydrolase